MGRVLGAMHMNDMQRLGRNDAISHAVDTLLVNPRNPVSASALATLIMDTALESAGNETNDMYTLCARSGRKRAASPSAVDKCIK